MILHCIIERKYNCIIVYLCIIERKKKTTKKKLKCSITHTGEDIIYSDTFSNHCHLNKYFIIILINRQKMKQYLFSLYPPINSQQIQIQTEINSLNLIFCNIKGQINYTPSVAPSEFLFTVSWFRQQQYSQNQ